MQVVERGQGWEMRLGRWQDSPPESVDVIISDPPYSQHVSDNMRAGGNPDDPVREFVLSFDGITPCDVATPLLAIARRWVALWCAIEQVGDYERAAVAAGHRYVRALAWLKTNPTPQFTGDRPAMWGEVCALMHHGSKGRMEWNGGGSAGVYRGGPERVDRFHETQKPRWLMLEQIQQFTNPGDLVWDPYAGSATTGVAALLRGRKFLGHEVQEEYFLKACERLRAAEQGLTLKDYNAGQLPLV